MLYAYGDYNGQYRCSDGRAVTVEDHLSADGTLLTIDGATTRLEHYAKVGSYTYVFNSTTMWVAPYALPSSLPKKLYDLGSDGQPIDPDGVECE